MVDLCSLSGYGELGTAEIGATFITDSICSTIYSAIVAATGELLNGPVLKH